MTQRTCNIILACKGVLYPQVSRILERVKLYLSDECDCNYLEYTNETVEQILYRTLYDYVDSCDKPSSILWDIFQPILKYDTLIEQICAAFSLVEVRNNDGSYINGFKEEFIENAKLVFQFQ